MCDGVSENGTHRLMALCERIQTCGLVGGSIVTEGSNAQDRPCLFLPVSCLDLVCLLAAMLPTMVTADYMSETVSQPQLNTFLYKSCWGHGVSLQQ